MRIVILGSGNVATHMAHDLCEAGFEVAQIFSRTLSHACALAQSIGCAATDDVARIVPDADAYLFSVKDDALPHLAQALAPRVGDDAVFIHTAGSVPMSVFEGLVRHCGVLYPMQTFSKRRAVVFRQVPCFVEYNDAEAASVIDTLSHRLSDSVTVTTSDKRRMMHLAAVFACNMTNHCYRLAERIVEGEGLDFRCFLPLIEETARKVTEMSPHDAQTGPMVRGDQTVMRSQLALLQDERMRTIYQAMADSIHADANP